PRICAQPIQYRRPRRVSRLLAPFIEGSAAHGGRVVALGRFHEAVAGEIKPRSVLILVEWESKAAFDSYRKDPKIADLHPHREKGTCDYIWHLFDKLDDLRPILK